MKKWNLVFLFGIAALAGCVSDQDYQAATTEVSNQDETIRKLREENERLRAANANLQNQYDLAQVELNRLRAADGIRGEIDSLRPRLENLGSNVTITERGDGTALTVEGSVLFKTGSDDISDGGRKILLEIADKIRPLQNRIRVEGHTDNVPVSVTIAKYPKGNLQLSGNRALNVADFLIGQGQVERARMCFAGYGAERPVADNGSDDGRSKNRRVEIVILNQN